MRTGFSFNILHSHDLHLSEKVGSVMMFSVCMLDNELFLFVDKGRLALLLGSQKPSEILVRLTMWATAHGIFRNIPKSGTIGADRFFRF
jgi:hypothetical protein